MALSTTRWTRLAGGLAGATLAIGMLAGCSSDPKPAPATVTVQSDNGGDTPMMDNPNGDGSKVPCEGSVCHNPNHGAGNDPAENGGTVMENPNGDGQSVPCEGTVCTNPNHGAGG